MQSNVHMNISLNVQIRPKTFKNVYERSRKEDVRERYSIIEKIPNFYFFNILFYEAL